ncbi:hypothetical protein [[Eubacterium] cellulosolvens]
MVSKKILSLIILFSLFLVSLNPVQTESTVKDFSLAYFDLKVTYPPQGLPGDLVSITFTADAKKTIQLEDLLIQIYSYDHGGDLQLIFSDSLVKDQRVRQGDSFEKGITITLPADTPRSTLLAVVAERVKVRTSYYPYVPYWPWYKDFSYPWWPYPYWIESYPTASSETTDSVIMSLTYILTPTPEYLELENRYDELENRYQQLTSEYDTLDTRYVEVEKDFQTKSSEALDLQAQKSQLLLELDTTRMWMYLFAVTTIIFVVTAVIIAILARRSPRAQQRSQAILTHPPKQGEPDKPQLRRRGGRKSPSETEEHIQS